MGRHFRFRLYFRFHMFVQYFDTVGWVFLLTSKTVSQITYTLLVETLNPAQSISQCIIVLHIVDSVKFVVCGKFAKQKTNL